MLIECAVSEPLSHQAGIELHPTLFNTPLIYGPADATTALADIYRSYIGVAIRAARPLLLMAPTWRLDADRVREARVPASINTDAVDFLRSIRAEYPVSAPLSIGALVGPRNDCYRADLALSAAEAEEFHSAQISQLIEAGVDYLMVQTMPAVSEAIGIARAIGRSEVPYIISFCTATDGVVLDGARLPEAFDQVDTDSKIQNKPLGYFVNCTHPSFYLNSYTGSELDRLIGIQANGSSKDVRQIEGSDRTVADSVDEWTESMLRFQGKFSVPILGGCCGTSVQHLQSLAEKF